jgi:hypothetical protein
MWHAERQLLRLFRKEHEVVIIPLGGDRLATGNREMELQESFRISSSISTLIDSERSSASDHPKEDRARFAETCAKLKIDLCLTQHQAIENYLTDRAVKAAFGR